MLFSDMRAVVRSIGIAVRRLFGQRDWHLGPTLDRDLPAAKEGQINRLVFLSRYLCGRGCKVVDQDAQMVLFFGRNDIQMTLNEGMGAVYFVEGDIDVNVLLAERHVLVHLQSFVKVADLTQLVQELVDALLVLLHKRVGRQHVAFLGIRGPVGQILQHLGNLHKAH